MRSARAVSACARARPNSAKRSLISCCSCSNDEAADLRHGGSRPFAGLAAHRAVLGLAIGDGPPAGGDLAHQSGETLLGCGIGVQDAEFVAGIRQILVHVHLHGAASPHGRGNEPGRGADADQRQRRPRQHAERTPGRGMGERHDRQQPVPDEPEADGDAGADDQGNDDPLGSARRQEVTQAEEHGDALHGCDDGERHRERGGSLGALDELVVIHFPLSSLTGR